jgi:cyanophycinase
MTPSRGQTDAKRGYIVPIGGAVKKRSNPIILEKFIDICGGRNSVIAVIPTATKEEENGRIYTELFSEMGADKVYSLNINKRTDCSRDDYLSQLEDSTGIFISGGNQLRLSTIIGGTPVAKLIRRLNADGAHIAGTSAGAAIMPEHMISGGRSGSTPTPRSVSLSPGLGLTNSIVIDQHFRQRNRLGRLLAAIAYSPFLTGIGIDENTAAFIDPNDTFTVFGSGAVTVVDPSEMKATSASMADHSEAISISNVKLHVLAAGSTYNLNTHTAKVIDSDFVTLSLNK